MKKNTRPEFNSDSNVKMTNTTKKRLEGTCPSFEKEDLGCKDKKNKKYTNQFK
ncbi:hypothetical protein [Romboutsia sp. 1001713B170131_170501_G6]|uniref:hypothetical protein n=1 Tax=Romboutsia sp. 1001713B170131_170501_G6 TaxID=2787108 RepID=UPI0018A9EF50|nr:hypothetical protein [Romboutsia sp. 1001713B170131_170501_G6]